MNFVEAWCDSWETECNEISARLMLLKKSHQLEYANGVDLENIGALFRVYRHSGETDDYYRNRLKSYVAQFVGGGTKQSIINTFNNAYGITVDVEDMSAATFRVWIDLLSIGGSSAGLSAAVISDVVTVTKAVGTDWDYMYYISVGDTTDKIFMSDLVSVSPGILTYMVWDVDNYNGGFWAP